MSGPGRQEERPGTPGNASEPPKSTPCRTRERKTRCFCLRTVVATIFLRLLSFFGLFVKSAKSPKYRACQQNQGFAHSCHESCRSRKVASKNDENRSQNRSEIVENRVSGPPGRPCRSTFAARSARVEQFSAIRRGSDGSGGRRGWLDGLQRWAKLDATASSQASLGNIVIDSYASPSFTVWNKYGSCRR